MQNLKKIHAWAQMKVPLLDLTQFKSGQIKIWRISLEVEYINILFAIILFLCVACFHSFKKCPILNISLLTLSQLFTYNFFRLGQYVNQMFMCIQAKPKMNNMHYVVSLLMMNLIYL